MRRLLVAVTDQSRLTLCDAMLLVAGTALGVAVARDYWPHSERFGRGSPSLDPPWLIMLSHLLYGLTLSALFIQLRRTRPPLWRYGRRPGLSACVAVVLASAFQFAFTAVWGRYSSRFGPVFLSVSVTRPHVIAPAVAVAWLTLAIACRWRPSPTWPDRLGRLVGASWLVLYFVSLAWLGQ
jgi:hypothetical protein